MFASRHWFCRIHFRRVTLGVLGLIECTRSNSFEFMLFACILIFCCQLCIVRLTQLKVPSHFTGWPFVLPCYCNFRPGVPSMGFNSLWLEMDFVSSCPFFRATSTCCGFSTCHCTVSCWLTLYARDFTMVCILRSYIWRLLYSRALSFASASVDLQWTCTWDISQFTKISCYCTTSLISSFFMSVDQLFDCFTFGMTKSWWILLSLGSGGACWRSGCSNPEGAVPQELNKYGYLISFFCLPGGVCVGVQPHKEVQVDTDSTSVYHLSLKE